MPNHCYNRVTIYGSGNNTDETRAQIAKLKAIFEDEKVFGQIIQEPDWTNTPLLTSDNRYGTKYGNDGELPVRTEDPFVTYRFQSTGRADERWYDWRVNHWGTKWDAYDLTVEDEDEDQLEFKFNTAWSPPEPICAAIREDYPDLSVSWFYDEPGCEIAGYL